MNATEFKRFTDAQDEIRQLRCDNIPCHQRVDILSSLHRAMAQLPACGTNGIMCAAAQEIDALRGLVADWLEFTLNIYPGGGQKVEALSRLITRAQQATQTKGE